MEKYREKIKEQVTTKVLLQKQNYKYYVYGFNSATEKEPFKSEQEFFDFLLAEAKKGGLL